MIINRSASRSTLTALRHATRFLVRLSPLVAILVITSGVAFAQTGTPSTKPPEEVLTEWGNWLIVTILPPVGIILTAVAGFFLMMGGHDGMRRLGYVAAGLVIVVMAVGIVNTFISFGQ